MIRADAVPATGTGHLGRCLALAAGARSAGWRVEGVGQIADAGVRARAAGFVDAWHPLTAVDKADELSIIEAVAPDWIALDGYRFTLEDQRALRRRGRLLVLDDGPRLPAYAADLLLDQNLGAEARAYAFEGEGRALLGSRYTLLRPEFLARTDRDRQVAARATRLLVSLGGMVEPRTLADVVAAIETLPAGLDITCLTGTDPGAMALAERRIDTRHRWTLLPWHEDMPGLMAATDLAISAAGSTAWELAYLGVPAVYAVLADNQAGIAAAVQSAGAGVDLGCCDAGFGGRLAAAVAGLIDDAPRRSRMADAGRALIDGKGVLRVLEAMT